MTLCTKEQTTFILCISANSVSARLLVTFPVRGKVTPTAGAPCHTSSPAGGKTNDEKNLFSGKVFSKMKIVLIRHGQTEGNRAKRYVGKTNEPLCAAGIEHAKTTGIFPEIKHVFVTPLTRTQETARIKFPNSELEEIPDFREMDFGTFEGKSSDEMEDCTDYAAWVDGMCKNACPGGEDIFSFADRVKKAFTELVNACTERGDKAVYIVAHGGTISAIMEAFALPRQEYFHWFLDNCGAFVTNYDASANGGEIVLTDYKHTDGSID